MTGDKFYFGTNPGGDSWAREVFERASREAARVAADDEERIRGGLGEWVSEVEPWIIRRAGDGALLGIGWEGSGEPVIPL